MLNILEFYAARWLSHFAKQRGVYVRTYIYTCIYSDPYILRHTLRYFLKKKMKCDKNLYIKALHSQIRGIRLIAQLYMRLFEWGTYI